MKAITAYTEEEYNKMLEKQKALNEAIKGLKRTELLNYSRCSKYAKYEFKGTYTDKLVEALGNRHPDGEEIIMLIDGGFSHFGASCSVNAHYKTFSGYIYID